MAVTTGREVPARPDVDDVARLAVVLLPPVPPLAHGDLMYWASVGPPRLRDLPSFVIRDGPRLAWVLWRIYRRR